MNPGTFKVLDTVVLDRDLPEVGLRRDLGAVVEVYEDGGQEWSSSQPPAARRLW